MVVTLVGCASRGARGNVDAVGTDDAAGVGPEQESTDDASGVDEPQPEPEEALHADAATPEVGVSPGDAGAVDASTRDTGEPDHRVAESGALLGTMIGEKPTPTWPNSTVRFTFFSSVKGASYECRIDDNVWTNCISPYILTLANGKHHFEVRAVDAIGNIDAKPATYDFAIVAVPSEAGPCDAASCTPDGSALAAPDADWLRDADWAPDVVGLDEDAAAEHGE